MICAWLILYFIKFYEKLIAENDQEISESEDELVLILSSKLYIDVTIKNIFLLR